MDDPRSKSWFPVIYALPFLVAFGLSVWMLASDMNLQTDFGTKAKYFLHWYVILVTAVADFAAVVGLILLRSRLAVKLGVAGSGLLALVYVGAIFTYSQVGFSNATQMADYLFGVNYYGGDVRYLYTTVLATYVFTFLLGLVGLWLTRRSKGAPSPAGTPA